MGRILSQVSDPIGSAELASDVGSALVGYMPAGTDPVATTVQSKLRETVSVTDFGALGTWNGVSGSNDTLAIQKAIDAKKICKTNFWIYLLCKRTIAIEEWNSSSYRAWRKTCLRHFTYSSKKCIKRYN